MASILASILALVMTWAVESKAVVSCVGDVPSQAVAEYKCTYQRGDVRAGDSAVFRLSGIDGMVVERIEVYVKSNKSSGAGEIRLAIDGQNVTEISGTMQEWTGEYDNSAYHAIEVLDGLYRVSRELMIVVKGSANSLHIEKYVIYYRAASPHTVLLMAGQKPYAQLSESSAGEGVVLPSVSDMDDWRFAGWSERNFQTLNARPVLWLAGETYFPRENTTLWAVWEQQQSGAGQPVSVQQPGVYLYAFPEFNIALSGLPEDGKMENAPIHSYDTNQWYWFEFNTAGDSATIQHVPTGSYIGYTGNRLVIKKSVWQVLHKDGKTAVYMNHQGKTYVLWLSTGGDYEGRAMLWHTGQVEALMTLLPVTSEETVYTCHPEAEAIETVEADARKEKIVDFGIYEIYISNGKKYLRLHN